MDILDMRHPQDQADAGHSLPRNQVPEWASSYINYKGLKKLIKAAVHTANSGEKVDLAGGTSLSDAREA